MVSITNKKEFLPGTSYLSNLTVEGCTVRVLWARTITKKPWECCLCARAIPAKGEAYRPLNGRFTTYRICFPCMHKDESG